MRVQTLFQQETLHAQRTRRLEGVAARTVTRTVLLADADTVRSRQSEAPCAHPPRRPETRPPGTRALPRGPRHWGRGSGGTGQGEDRRAAARPPAAPSTGQPRRRPRSRRRAGDTAVHTPCQHHCHPPSCLPGPLWGGRAAAGASRGCFRLSWVSVASPHSRRRYLHRLQPLHVFAFYILNLAL